MGKKKSKNNKHLLPKRIGGVKIPKQLRKSANQLFALANDPKTKELLASGLAVAAAVLAKGDAGTKAAGKAKKGLKALDAKSPDSAHEVVATLGATLNSALEHLFGGRIEWRTSDADATAPASDGKVATQH